MSNILLISSDQNQSNLKTVKNLSFAVLIIALVIESICFILVYPSVVALYGNKGEAAFIALFHSVASFTNAGFALTDLSIFQESSFFLLVTAFVVLLGSVGFPTIVETLLSFRKKKSLFTKINLQMHALLLGVGFILIFILEYNNGFQHLSWFNKFTNTIFLSATARSGGLAPFDINTFQVTTILAIIVLMFIGGASSSTGGGIRLTTFAVLVSKVLSIAKSKSNTVIMKRTISEETVNKAFLIFFVFVTLITFSTIFMSYFEPLPLEILLFEVISALSNTGLSFGITPSLSSISKLILILLMLVGRIGIFTIIYLIFKIGNTKVQYLKEDLAVG